MPLQGVLVLWLLLWWVVQHILFDESGMPLRLLMRSFPTLPVIIPPSAICVSFVGSELLLCLSGPSMERFDHGCSLFAPYFVSQSHYAQLRALPLACTALLCVTSDVVARQQNPATHRA